MKRALLFIMFLLLFAGCGEAEEATAVPPQESVGEATAVSQSSTSDPILDMPAGWTEINPRGDARCAHDTEFAFWVRPGSVNKLLVYFQGGGGCWSYDTCQVGSSFYDASVGIGDSPNGRGGILNLENPDNPFAKYHIVYVPSCTGDIYLGDNVQTYEDSDGDSIDIYHRGFMNLSAALDWTFANVLDPESIFVTGCSAGSIGSIRATPHLINQYPDAQVAQLGDSLGFLFDQPSNADTIYGIHHTLPEWIPAFAEFDPNAFTMASFYNAVADFYPNVTFAQFNTERDSVQVRYHTAGGESASSFAQAMADAISAIHAKSPNFRSFTAEGDVHCIMPRNDFYSRQVNGVLFRDWVADLAAGREVESVQCADCLVTFGPLD